MKTVLALVATLALPGLAVAQDFGAPARSLAFDLGLGAELGPSYPGSGTDRVTPWIIIGGTGSGTAGMGNVDQQGLGISPSVGTKGKRDFTDGDELIGLDGIDGAVELGLRLSYGLGPVTGYGSVRRGFGGHEGVTGNFGAKYRINVSDRVTLWTGAEAVYGNAEFNDTYFGVTAPESRASGLPPYEAGSGINEAALTLQARYALSENVSLLGEVRYGRLVGDAADSPVVQDETQSSVRLGVTRRFSFGF